MSEPPCILFAGGGTGGHLFPGIAVAQELRRRYPQWSLPFVGTERGVEVRQVPRYGFALHTLNVHALRGRTATQRLRGAAALPAALAQAVALVRRLKPKVAVSVGGYAAGPAILAAWACRVPCVVLEQNAHAGMTNRALARVAKHVLLALPNAQLSGHGGARVVGNPVRSDLLALATRPLPTMPTAFTGQRPLRLLVFGGSQGAQSINTALAQVAPALASEALPLRILHQTGRADEARVRHAYADAGVVQATVLPFIDDMASAMHDADLLLCRSGAGTLAEAAVVGRPSWLVPYPHAADDHQTANARVFAHAGAARLWPEPELTPAALLAALATLCRAPSSLMPMARAARALGKPTAATDIADIIANEASPHVS